MLSIAVPSGYGKVVRGRIDGRGSQLSATYQNDKLKIAAAGESVLSISTSDVLIKNDFSSLQVENQLSGLRIEPYFDIDTKLLRLDAHERPEFWIEVDMAYFTSVPLSQDYASAAEAAGREAGAEAARMAVDDEATDLAFEKEIAERANSPTALLIMKGISPIMVKDHFQISCSDVDGDGTLIFQIDDNPNESPYYFNVDIINGLVCISEEIGSGDERWLNGVSRLPDEFIAILQGLFTNEMVSYMAKFNQPPSSMPGDDV